MAASRMPPRPSQSTGDAPRRSPPTIRGARRPPHRPPPRTVTAPPTRPAFLFLRAAARMPHVPMPPEPIDGRRAATQPTDDPACARAPPAAHTARRHAPSPRPRCDPPFVPPSCRMNASRANAARANRRETRRDGAHRRSAVRARARRPPHRPPPRTVTAPPTRPAFWFTPELPHECLTSQCLPSLSTGDAPRRSPPDDPSAVPAATHRHRAPDATPRPPAPPFCSTRAAARPHEPMPPEPIDGRRTATQPTGRSIRGARRHAPSPRPRRDPTSTRAALLFHPSCRTASRANAARAYRRETHRDRRRTPPLLSTRVPALGQDARHASPACSERLGRAAVVCVRFRENSRDSGARAPAPCTMMVLDHHRPDERTRPTTEAH